MAEVQDLETDEVGELEAVTQQIEQPKQEAASNDDLPPQFRGKSASEIARYALSQEQALSRQGNELGEVRRLADELLKSQLMATKAKEVDKPKEVDFFENPQEAIRQQIESNPKVMAAEQYSQHMQKEYAKQAFFNKHPDAKEVIGNPAFQEWVKASKVRTQLFRQADQFDVDAGDELLSTFKQLNRVRQEQVSKVDTEARDKTLRAVSVDSGGTGESSKKVYRRADLIRLKMRDPSRYEAMSDDIMSAYQEGRVR